ncbi:ABC transporter substrate-binding protein [Cellvibrio japonicus]|uniref:ABC transporter substrate-binding protein n=1 Tax=Cellvibrio japonicus TaxID=155077 RepID=UPI0002E16DCA|nr:ABC transporter substrate-binding protein [Cellvibrio japonicus]QEI12695.1 ABC transporter substrate-binding protein [Cellvibrio japonicus]QEI16269.1 ABC transporter substrate-binding protein [Cellvibrio japonicus]QEI19847.1 ABC transporter substrate-binding protein [Cellvibrio japonicus]
MYKELTRRGFLVSGAALGGSLLLGGGLSGCSQDTPVVPLLDLNTSEPRYGGRLRLGVIDGDQTGSLDVHKPTSTGSTIRGFALYSKLWEWDENMFPRLALAEEAEVNADATAWIIRLKPGLEFHHGKTIDADDLIFSIRRLSDPQLASPYGNYVNIVDRDNLEKLDNRTVRIRFKEGRSFLSLPDTWVNFGGIVPVDYHPVNNPVGAGPYKLKQFLPGQRSLFTRFEHYFKPGQPYADELEIIDFKDQISRYAALVGGQIDIANAIAPEQKTLFDNNPKAKLLVSESGTWRAFNMNTAKAPFDDVRVRQAFRLLTNRQELVDRVLIGEGRIANDLYAPHDPTFNRHIPQRQLDIAEAKSLLRSAGHDKLTLELTTDAAGANAALVFAEQARLADVRIHVKKIDNATFNGPRKNEWVMSTGGSLGQPFLAQATSQDGPTSASNRTNFRDERFTQLYFAAQAQPDLGLRTPLVHEAQEIQHSRGGLLIWGFTNFLDGYTDRVGGLTAECSHFSTWRFDNIWLRS